MYWVSELLQQLLGEKLWDGSNIRTSTLIALEGRLVRSIKDKDGVDSERDQAQEAVVKGS